jgi:hypothetical protein
LGSLDAGAHLLGDARRGEQAQRQHHQDEGRKVLHGRHQRRQHEVPQEDLHQQRDVAKQLDPGIAQRASQGLLGRVRMTPISEPTTSATTSAVRETDTVQPQAENSQSR